MRGILVSLLVAGSIFFIAALAFSEPSRTNSAGTGYDSIESFTTLAFETGTVTDIDGNVYQTIKIGDQWWMAENLKVTQYRNSDAIPNVTDNAEWAGLSTGAYCGPDVATYGMLYNWFAVDDSRNIAPEGWHVPTDDEWKQLEMYLGMSQAEADATGWRGTDEGGKLKETGTTHWWDPNSGATNESGFTALPGGNRNDGGDFGSMLYDGYFWSSTESSSGYVLWRGLNYSNSGISRTSNSEQFGFSVRCVKDEITLPEVTTATVSGINPTTAECGGTVTSDGGATVTARGVCWSTDPTPTVADNTTSDGTGTGSFTSYITGLTAGTTYYVRAYATNSAGTGYGDPPVSFTTLTCGETGTVTDVEGYVYQTVKIGDQWWMAENLRVRKYSNNDPIPNITDGGIWFGLTTGAYCEYNNDNANVATYGRLYNWFALDDSRNIAPEGWHVPTDDEWKQLEMYLGMSQSDADAIGFRGTDEGGKLKEAGTTNWDSPNTGATNQYCFTALPGGNRNDGGDFGSMLYDGYFWSSTESSSGYALWRGLNYSNSGISRTSNSEQFGFSVRCVKDEITLPEDSLYISPIDISCLTEPIYNDGFIVPIRFRCATPTTAMNIPIEWDDPNLILESVEFAGTAVENWSNSALIDNDNRTVLLGLIGFGEPESYYIDFDTDSEIARLRFKYTCDPDQVASNISITLDTTFMGDVDNELLFVALDAYGFSPNVDLSPISINPYRPGDANGDCAINILDIVYIINHKYKDGPPPTPLEAGDVNADCFLNILDVVSLINFKYKGGPDPECGCYPGSGAYKQNPITYDYIADAELNTSYSAGKTLLYINSPIDLAALNVTMQVVDGSIPQIINKLNGLRVYFSQKGDEITLALLDITGNSVISSGKNIILEIDGEVEILSALGVDQPAAPVRVELVNGVLNDDNLPLKFELSQNFPNPFNPTTEIAFSLPSTGEITLQIFNIAGQQVRTLTNGMREAGTHRVIWNGRNDQGSDVSSGIYFYRLNTGEFTETKKMILLK